MPDGRAAGNPRESDKDKGARERGRKLTDCSNCRLPTLAGDRERLVCGPGCTSIMEVSLR